MDSKVFDSTQALVLAYLSRNKTAIEDIASLWSEMQATVEAALGVSVIEPEAVKLVPAVPVSESITGPTIICLEDGRELKSMKRHLRTKYDLTPEQYRQKWGLPKDYPMVAPDYAAERSRLAKKMGLGKS